MFIDFFFLLRRYKIPVTLNEWMLLMQALQNGLIDSDLNRFYFVARALLVKTEAHFDTFDQIFAHYFKGSMEPAPLNDKIRDWLNRMPLKKFFSPEELEKLKKLNLEELEKMFRERLAEQKKEHHGGNRWIGTGGTSPFGHGGYHPSGIRVAGQSGNRMALKVASERHFRNYRHDLTLDVRQVKLALKELRELKRHGQKTELDVDSTIDYACRNAGEIEFIFQAERKNQTKLILLMDVGGTMDPYAETVSLLFSAAHSSEHFRDFRYYYFHNCVYSRVYTNMERNEWISTADLFHKFNSDYKLVFVGDAWMNPYELYAENGIIDFFSRESVPGIVWLERLKQHFPTSVWLNPENPEYWHAQTIAGISGIFPMFPLTLDGLHDAVEKLK